MHTHVYILLRGLYQTLCRPQVREVSQAAGWNAHRLSHGELLHAIAARGKTINPLLEAAWVTSGIFRKDWLHVADQGVTADFLANEFFLLSAKYPGATKQDRYNAMFQDILQHYEDENIDDRLDCLLVTFVEQKRARKLRTSAAKCRKLVGFAYKLALELCDERVPAEHALRTAAHHLNECYCALSSSLPEDEQQAKLLEHGPKFAAQYVALHDYFNPDGDGLAFRIKPKMHLFMHICIDGGVPSKTWCYRDEDFGGSAAHASHRRGGLMKPSATSRTTLHKFAIGTPRISIR